MPTQVPGIVLALTSAAVWGSGDFSGGVAARRTSEFQVLVLAALSGIVILVLFALARQVVPPSPKDALWAAGAGLSGALAMAALYRALAMGQAAHVAPTAGVVSVALPVLVSVITEGWPGSLRMAGFAAAALGIWLVSASARQGDAGTQLIARPAQGWNAARIWTPYH
jgi:uncharacterized membrane protein